MQGPTICHQQVSRSIHCCPVLPLLLPTGRDGDLAQGTTAHMLGGGQVQLTETSYCPPNGCWQEQTGPKISSQLAQSKLDLCAMSSTALPTCYPGGEEGRDGNEHNACVI